MNDVVAPDGVAVINADGEHADAFIAAARRRDLRLITVGALGDTIKLTACERRGEAQALTVTFASHTYKILLPLAGAFQASNALVAAGLAIGLGEDAARVFAALAHLKGAPGRMKKVAFAASGAPIYVDYAHTPDLLEKILQALRPHTQNALHVVFGCGGDRDKGKRPLMGQIASPWPMPSSSPTIIRVRKIPPPSAAPFWPRRQRPSRSAIASRQSTLR